MADSSSPAAMPYIGSKINLISKSDIRYEGFLYSIDPKESKVSLSQGESSPFFGFSQTRLAHPLPPTPTLLSLCWNRPVHSHGTEGRRGGVNEIPPSPEVYEYITFRGTDIKDLRVSDVQPPKPAAPAFPADPAIISVSFFIFLFSPFFQPITGFLSFADPASPWVPGWASRGLAGACSRRCLRSCLGLDSPVYGPLGLRIPLRHAAPVPPLRVGLPAAAAAAAAHGPRGQSLPNLCYRSHRSGPRPHCRRCAEGAPPTAPRLPTPGPPRGWVRSPRWRSLAGWKPGS